MQLVEVVPGNRHGLRPRRVAKPSVFASCRPHYGRRGRTPRAIERRGGNWREPARRNSRRRQQVLARLFGLRRPQRRRFGCSSQMVYACYGACTKSSPVNSQSGVCATRFATAVQIVLYRKRYFRKKQDSRWPRPVIAAADVRRWRKWHRTDPKPACIRNP